MIYDDTAGNVVRYSRDARIGLQGYDPCLRFDVPIARVEAVITRWMETAEGVRLTTKSSGADWGFIHIESITYFFGFVHDVGIRYTRSEHETIVEWHSQSRWASDFDRSRKLLEYFAQYLKENV